MQIKPITDYSSLFSGLSTSSNNLFNNINVGDYSQIKNGSYGKLVKQYYKKTVEPNKSINKVDSKNKADKTNASSIKPNAITEKLMNKQKQSGVTKTAATSLSDTIKKMTDKNKPEVTKDTVKSFVDKYNNLQKNASKSETGTIKAASTGLSSLTNKNSDKLAKIGITVEKDNTLKIDEEKFKSAKDEDVKSVFKNDYLKDVNKYAEKIDNYAQRDIGKLANYNEKASANSEYINGLNFDSLV